MLVWSPRSVRQLRLFGILLLLSIAAGWALRGRTLVHAQGPTGSMFFTDRVLHRRLIQARELLTQSEPNYVEAARALQSVLENDEDSFFPPDQNDRTKYLGLKSEAARSISEMTPAGRKVYEELYGAQARQSLTDAIKARDSDGIAQVARRFFHTRAGNDALYLLATEHLDHARPLAAALCFQRLLETPTARTSFGAMLAVQAAVAWERAGDRGTAVKILLELQQREPGAKVELAGKPVALPTDARSAGSWLSSNFGAAGRFAQSGQDQWPQFRGDAARNAAGTGGSPYLNGGWHLSTIGGVPKGEPQDKLDELLERSFTERLADFRSSNLDRNYPAIPSAHPLVVQDLVIFRDYGHVRAHRLADGKSVWTSTERDKSLRETLEMATRNNSQTTLSLSAPLALLFTQRAWRDSTFGTLSSDGDLVFAVEDTGFVGPYAYNALAPHPLAPRPENRLAAYDLRTGKAAWEVGGPPEYAGDLSGMFFLGPPLVWEKHLYCLVEAAGGDIRLIVLEPLHGKVEWSQTLVRADLNLMLDPTRRMCGLTPSYAGGVLVCPTEAGAIVAVDLTTRSLLWRYVYANPGSIFDQRMMGRRGFRGDNSDLFPPRSQATFGNELNRWVESPVTIADGRVLLTPRERDANELHCVNLIDGSLAWKHQRGEGMYVAGVHAGNVVIVERLHLQAVRLADGVPVWQEPTAVPLPSGRGFMSANLYHLPLTTAEVATIDMTNGRIVSRTQSRDGRVPGNLVGLRGAILSQGVDGVDCFREMQTLETELAATLEKNPSDASALALRAEIFLQRGKTGEAYADLQRVLQLKSDDARVREVLLLSLLEGLRVDFTTYRKSQAEIEKLLDTPEQHSTYLRLLAAGLDRSNERKAAFDVYFQFVEHPPASAEVERIDSALSIGRDRIVRTRAANLYERCTQEERTAIDAELLARFEKLRDKNEPEQLQRFLDYFGGQFTADAARQKLVELLTPAGDRLLLERWLRKLEESADPKISAEGTARLAAMLIDVGRPLEAIPSVKRLLEKFPSVVALDGKTGTQLADMWRKDPVIQRAITNVSPWPVGRVDVERKDIPQNIDSYRKQRVTVAGTREPFFAESVLELDQRGQDFLARDAYGREIWKVALPTQYSSYNIRAQLHDHLVLLVLGTQVLAVDTLGTAAAGEARLLWTQALSDAAPGSTPQIVSIRQPGGQRFVLTDQFGQALGSVGPISHDFVCLQRGRKLFALEPMTGKTLWVRDDLIPGSEVFGDNEYVFVIPPNGGDEAQVIQAIDGRYPAFKGVVSKVAVTRPLPPSQYRQATIGRKIVTWVPVPTENRNETRHRLSLYDVWSREVVWQRDFERDSKLDLIDLDEIAVLEPKGRFRVLNLADGRDRWDSMAEPSPGIEKIKVFRSPERYTLIANFPAPPVQNGVRVQAIGTQSMPVNGYVYGFDAKTGKRQWMQIIERHAIDVGQPASLPVLTFTCQYSDYSGRGYSQFGILCLDQRNGKIVYEDRRDEPLNSAEPVADPDQKRLELRLYRSLVQLTFTDKAIIPPPGPRP